MLFDTPIISEGTAIVNTTVESGASYPAGANIGEIFFKTDINDFVFRNSSTWVQYALRSTFDQHATNMTMHMTGAEKTLLSGITVSAAEINSIPQIKTDASTTNAALNTHKADMAVHLTAAQNTFLDGLNASLTSANVNTLVGQTVLLSTQFTNAANATAQVQTNLNTHSNNQTVHVLPAQRTWLDGIDMVKITPSIINSLDTISAGGSAANRVLKTGDTMSGVLNMSNSKITGLALPTVDSDATSKKYVDTAIAAFVPDLSAYVKKAGDTMTGNLNMSSKTVTGLAVPVNVSDATTKKYVDDLITLQLSLSGGTMTGILNMGNQKITGIGAPTVAADAATKGYVDTAITNGGFVKKAGDTMSGTLDMGNQAITNVKTPVNPGDAVHKSYADGKVAKAGDTMTGNLNMGTFKVFQSAVPAGTFDVTNKKYVDDAILAATSQPGPAESATKLTTARDISVSGAATGKTAAKFDGSADANIVVTELDATKLKGYVPSESLWGAGLTVVGQSWLGTDFNTLTSFADAKVYTLATNPSRINGPLGAAAANYNGILHVSIRGESSAPHKVVQTLYANQTTAVRFCNSSGSGASEVFTWTPWEYITTVHLGANIDLNSLQSAGHYGQPMNTQTSLALNYPVAQAGTLTVEVTSGANPIVTQKYHTYASDTLVNSTNYNQVYVRACYNTRWSEWRKLVQDDQVMLLQGDQVSSGKKTFTGQVVVNYGGNATSLATAAIGTTGGIWSNMMGNFGGLTSRGNVEILGNAIELGELTTASASYIDFHTSGVSNDHDSRIIATGGDGTNRAGKLEFVAGGGITLTGPVTLASGATGSLTGNASSATILQTARTFSISGGATATGVAFNGNGNVNLVVSSVDATKLSGIVPNANVTGVYNGLSVNLNGTNTIFTTPATGTQSGLARTVYGLAEYRNAGSTATGAFVFIAPATTTGGVMYTFEYIIREHGKGDDIIKGVVSAYRPNANGAWTNRKHISLGTETPMARVGYTPDGRPCLVLGDVANGWGYPHAAIQFAMMSHSGIIDGHAMGWTTDFVTDLTGYTQLGTDIATSVLDTKVASATSADSVAKLTTARKINTINFDGQSDINVPGWFSQPVMTAQTGTTRYNVQSGIYYDAIYQGQNMGYPIAYGSRQLIAARNTGNAMAQHELVYEWRNAGKNRIFYRSIGDVSTHQWSDFKEIAFVDSVVNKSEGLICNTYSNATPLNLDDLAGANAPGFLAFGGISGLSGSSHIVSGELPFAQNVDIVGFSLGYTHENMQLVFDNGIIKVRGNDANPGTSTTWSPWKQVAYTTDKLATAGIADSALALNTARVINGTSFNGTTNITTANWGTARNITIGSTAKSVNGSGNVAWSLTEIGAAPIVDPTFTNSITLNGTAFYVGSQGGSWIGGAAGASTLGGGVAATSSIRIATSTTTNAYHSWISQRTQTGVGYGIGTLGSDFFITMASKANIDSGNNSVYNVLKFDGVSRQTSIPGSLKLDYGTGESQIYFSGSNLYMYANAGSAGFYNGSTQKGCSVDNSGGLTVGGAVNAVGDVVAFYSDERLKENIRPIEEALKILRHIDGVRYNANALAGSFGFDTEREQLGLKAGQLKAILPELIERAPFDRGENGDSKSGEDYLTVKYERLVPVLVEGIKELDAENFGLKQKQKSLEERIARLEELLLE